MKPNKPAEIEPQRVQSKRISSYHYKPSKRSVAALLQLLHALLQKQANLELWVSNRQKASETRGIMLKAGWKAEEQGDMREDAQWVARAGGAQHATEPHGTPNERYATHTILHEPVKLLSASNSNHIK